MILCGGAGARLWPASRPWRPKPFLRLIGPHSGLQATVLRAAPLATDGRLVVVGSDVHADLIAGQLGEIGVSATVLLEPVARGTTAAIAAAAAWAQGETPGAVLAVLPADHHIADASAFAAAIGAAAQAAADGAVVTLGVRPTAPSTAYGYIRVREASGDAKPIAAFVEKPDAADASALIASGALWNCGIFVATAATLLGEIAGLAPEVSDAAGAAVAAATGGADVRTLGRVFAEAPAIAFDRAVMEKTARGAVLPVAFGWSDLGAWDAVAAATGETTLVRAAPGVQVSIVGLEGVAVVAESDAVLVAALDASQAVRPPAGPPAPFADLAVSAEAHDRWLRTAALPLWATVGVDPATGAFREALTWDGVPADPMRRTRVQARQAFVFASAAADGLTGPWLATARGGLDFLLWRARRADGLFATTVGLDGAQVEAQAQLYEHAFVLLSLAAFARADGAEGRYAEEAVALRDGLTNFRHAAGGFREAGEAPFQANAHMHLLEAALFWEAAGGDAGWAALADEIAALALDRFIDPASGALHEVFDADWRPLEGEAGLIEPGHQFEWAWLLEQWGAARGEARARDAARRLFAVGRRGFDPQRGVVQNALWPDLGVREAGARLWPQTEHLKAALILGETEAALEAAASLVRYLDTPARGVWRERMRADGGFVDQPAPASSLYHLYLAIRELTRLAGKPC